MVDGRLHVHCAAMGKKRECGSVRYSTSFGERDSRPFHEEPETFISILISSTPMHLEPFVMHSAQLARPQPRQESSTC